MSHPALRARGRGFGVRSRASKIRMTLKSALALMIAMIASQLACGCNEESGQKAGLVDNRPANFAPPPGASTETSPCDQTPTVGGTLRPLNHEGHGDSAVEIPPGYNALQNPCPRNDETAARGKALFGEHCARCHGAEGDPKDAQVKTLDPPAKRLTVGGFTEQYVFWRVEEGGAFEPFASQMPSFKETFSEDDAWMVTRHVLSLAGADATPLAPTMDPPVAIDGATQVVWRLASACKSLKLERKKDAAAYELAYTLAGFLTEYHDTAATSSGAFCYRIACEAGGKTSPASNESCVTR